MEVMCDAEMGVGLQLPVQNCITPGDAPAETHSVITYCRVQYTIAQSLHIAGYTIKWQLS